jgi:hypothetical protein
MHELAYGLMLALGRMRNRIAPRSSSAFLSTADILRPLLTSEKYQNRA